MDDVLSQLLLAADQPQWGCEALLGQVSPTSDPGYYSACSVSETAYNSACSFSDPAYNGVCQNSDLGYYSACGSVSPASSVDSGCFSPPTLPRGAADRSPLPHPVPAATAKAPVHQSPAQAGGRKSRSRHPGKKRQSASEREKLRMRDLAKAVSHLRNYLPTSVAPAGQTLTKIETLRLAIRYIGHLSAQLEEDRTQGAPAAFSPTLPVAQEVPQCSFQPTTAESLPAFQPGFTHSSDHLSPLFSYQTQE
ncbi:mesogenin-1-like [Conger conger]|uniref:mesogenin-1-like n=1 Tax=Conger conger TaxID=82655 RepID=UPI002A59C3C9|nr:mesogenin-1-like [Conger conger]